MTEHSGIQSRPNSTSSTLDGFVSYAHGQNLDKWRLVQPYCLAETKSLYFSNNVSNLTVNSQTFFRIWKNTTDTKKIIRKQLSKAKMDAVQEWKAKDRRFIIYKLWNFLNWYVFAVRMQFICTRAWYVVFQRHNRLWKVITPSLYLQKGFLKAFFCILM